jgi:hypothetical protein
MEAAEPPSLQAQDTRELLTAIIDELRSIGSILARQNERIEALSRAKDRAHPKEWDSVSVAVGFQCPRISHPISSYAQDSELRRLADSISSNSTASLSSTISTELRTGFILQEALTRYNLDSIPAWSPFYGTHLLHGEGPETAEDSIRNSEWAAAIGEFWKIPHDNRINFCFRAGMSGPASVLRVRNFVCKFHNSSAPNSPKGEFFNIWDWFDTGLSAYWYPGKTTAVLPMRFPSWLAGSSSKHANSFPLSTMVAPWRRVMWVLSSASS